MVNCCVPYCTSDSAKKDKNVTFHVFPKDPALKDKWKIAISRQGDKTGTLWLPSDFSRVCSLHFIQTDFSVSTTKKRLLPNTVPTIFLGYPTSKLKVVNERKKPPTRSSILPPKKKQKTCSTNDVSPPEDNVPFTKEIGTQASFPTSGNVHSKGRRSIRLRKCNYRLQERVNKLKRKLMELRAKNKPKETKLNEKIRELQKNADNGELKASFLLEQ